MKWPQRCMPFALAALAILTMPGAALAGILTSIPVGNIEATATLSQLFELGTVVDSDNTEPLSNLTALVSWGDGTIATVANLTGANGDFIVIGTHTFVQVGVYMPVVTAYNVGGSQVQFNDSLTVTVPQAGNPANIPAEEGSPANNVTVASFTDQNPNSTATSFSATIDWGDGSTSTGAVVSDGNGNFSVDGSHTYAVSGNYTPTVTIQETGGPTLVVNASANVTDAPLVAGPFSPSTLTAGVPLNGIIASFLDADPDGSATQFTAIINWGDGSAFSEGTIVSDGNGLFSVAAEHTFASQGEYGVTVNVFDEGGSTTTIAGTESVDPSPEPGSFLLAGAGLMTLLAARQRRC